MRIALLLVPLLLALPGCGTILTIATSGDSPRKSLVFSGTRADGRMLAGRVFLFDGPWRVLAALDLPLSFALDAALSPLTLVQSVAVRSGATREHEPGQDSLPPRPPAAPKPSSPDVALGGRPWREPRERSVDAPREYRSLR